MIIIVDYDLLTIDDGLGLFSESAIDWTWSVVYFQRRGIHEM